MSIIFDLNIWTVFTAALLTALATGVGVLPLIYFKTVSRKWISIANGAAAGLMLAASFSLIFEGFNYGPKRTILGMLLGFVLIHVSHRWIEKKEDLNIANLQGADAIKAFMIIGIMTVHSAAEGIGIGVAYGGSDALGWLLTLVIAIHNIPEGLAIALVIMPRGVSAFKATGWSIFSSLPQPLLAVPAFLFVAFFTPILPAGLGLAAGAMIWMTLAELIPEALEDAKSPTVAGAVTMAIASMLLFQHILGTPVPN